MNPAHECSTTATVEEKNLAVADAHDHIVENSHCDQPREREYAALAGHRETECRASKGEPSG